MLSLQRKIAENVLKKLQEAPDAWTRVDGILEQSKSQHSKFFALQVNLLPVIYFDCTAS